jgi:hypothetical protein
LRLAKYFALFVTKYRPKLRALCIHLHQQSRLSLHLNLNLDLNLNLYPSLLRAFLATLFETLLQKKLVPLLGSMLAALAIAFQLLTFGSSYPLLLPPRQPVGRPLPGRIVVRERYTTTCRWQSGPLLLPLLPEERVGVRSPANWRLRRDRTYARDRLRVKALVPGLPRSFRHSVPSSTADSTRDSRPDSTRG